jgi:hypothetical protein
MHKIGVELENLMLTILQCIVSIDTRTVLDDVLETCVLMTIRTSGS